MNQNGTLVTVRQNCTNCGESSFEWKSQPSTFGKYPTGNIALSFATLMAGATILFLMKDQLYSNTLAVNDCKILPNLEAANSNYHYYISMWI